jgi:hypothetical protein
VSAGDEGAANTYRSAIAAHEASMETSIKTHNEDMRHMESRHIDEDNRLSLAIGITLPPANMSDDSLLTVMPPFISLTLFHWHLLNVHDIALRFGRCGCGK